MKDHLHFERIGVVHSCFSEKFGIPRQPGLAEHAVGTIELEKEFSREEMVRGLDAFSHIWVTFIFHQAVADGWRSTVRPPWLGGSKRVGVFSSRSPHRPNFIGMSVVRLEEIRNENKRVFIDVSGIDMLDKTPVIDVKPYLVYSDANISANGGFSGNLPEKEIEIVFVPEVKDFCNQYFIKYGRELEKLLVEVLQQDPRPASQRSTDKEFGILLWNVNSRFVFSGDKTITVLRCEEK